MKRSVLFLALLLLQAVSAQALFTENFNYPEGTPLVGQNGWTAYYAGTPMVVGSAGLDFTGYEGSAVGKAVSITGGGASEHPYQVVSLAASGDVYLSFLVNISGTNATEGFFASLANANSGNFRAVVYAKIVSGALYFGARPTLSGTTTYDTTPYATGTTYLVILKYSYIDGVNNDEVRLYILSSGVPALEPETPNVGPLIMPNECIPIGSVVLSSGAFTAGSALNGAALTVDGIRVATTWSAAPLPVELLSFTASAKDRGAELSWKTATEVNNYGFEIEKKAVSGWPLANSQQPISNSWSKIGFVEGNGTTNSPKSYNFVDVSAQGKVAYRLKQIDRDGKFTYSNQVEAVASVISNYALAQNHPNPFNPSTVINYQLPMNSVVTLKVYDAIGREVATLVNGMQEAGEHAASFNASHLPSGLYFYSLQTKNFNATKKMLLVK
jgi:hypothetical protein